MKKFVYFIDIKSWKLFKIISITCITSKKIRTNLIQHAIQCIFESTILIHPLHLRFKLLLSVDSSSSISFNSSSAAPPFHILFPYPIQINSILPPRICWIIISGQPAREHFKIYPQNPVRQHCISRLRGYGFRSGRRYINEYFFVSACNIAEHCWKTSSPHGDQGFVKYNRIQTGIVYTQIHMFASASNSKLSDEPSRRKLVVCLVCIIDVKSVILSVGERGNRTKLDSPNLPDISTWNE